MTQTQPTRLFNGTAMKISFKHTIVYTSVALAIAAVSPQAWAVQSAVRGAPSDQAPIHDVKQSSTETDRLAVEAVKLIGENRLEDATAKIGEALRLRMDRSYYHLINGLAYHLQARQGKSTAYDLAEQGYQLAMQFDPSNWTAYYFAGLLAIDSAKYSRACQLLSEALIFRPDDPGVLHALSYAAYRSGNPDIAAGAVDALAKRGQAASSIQLRNNAMIMAAAGNQEKARDYLQRLGTLGDRSLSEHVEQRLNDWSGFHGEMVKTQFGGAAPGGGAFGGAPPGGGGFGGAAPGGGAFGGAADAGAMGGMGGMGGAMPAAQPTTAPGTENKMVVVDVVMIATEEDFSTARGVNLLNGLQLQFGDMKRSFTRSIDQTGALVSNQTFTRALGIPSINYTLNILNTNNQRNEILARPTLVARTGKSSNFFSGVELNAVAVSNSANAGSPVNINKEIGVQLSLLPVFLEDGRIAMDVSAERTFIKTPNSDVAFTFRLEVSKSKVSANVVMRYGETLILGGLSEKEAENTRDGVPLLQDIPGIQYMFSRNTTRDFQKSVLILITPRPPQYVYQPEKARQEYEKSLSEDERPLANLRSRYSDWFKPYPNWASVFHHMQDNTLYREFRTGDVTLENWADMRSLKDRLNKVLEFLYY